MSIPARRPSLKEDHRATTRERVLTAARRVLAEKGLAATTDDVAAAAEVSRRTVFRHFPTHDELMAEAVTSLLDLIGSDLAVEFAAGEDVDNWLEALTVRLHRRMAEDYGQAFWDIQRPDPDRPAVLAAAVRSIPERRTQYAAQVASTAWQAAGGPGDPPALLVEATALLGSAYGANYLASGTGRTPEETGRMAAGMMSAILRDALTQQPGTLPVRVTSEQKL